METNKEPIDNLIEEVKDYLETKSKLSKLKALDKGSRIAGDSAGALLITTLFLLFLLFISIAGALALSELIKISYVGFLLVALFYLIVGIIVYVNRTSWIKIPLKNILIRNFFKDSEDED